MQPPNSSEELEELLRYLRDRRGFDFAGYKRASLARRIARRMHATGAENFSSYVDILEANPDEFAELFDTILINVTDFLRDKEAWAYLAGEVIPSIASAKAPTEYIRVWTAGCASGEEAYSLAVLFSEAVGEERFRDSIKIYATDADEGALALGRLGRYPAGRVDAAFGRQRALRFFEFEGDQAVFRQDLRRSLIFGRHDLVQDPPISKIDLLSCRNTLMYFTAELQKSVLSNFHFALNPHSYLFLGKSETMAATTDHLFEPVELRRRVFRKDGSVRAVPPVALRSGPPAEIGEGRHGPLNDVFEQSPTPQIVLDASGVLKMANRAARRLFGLGSLELGHPLSGIDLLSEALDVSGLVEQSMRARRSLVVEDLTWSARDGQESSSFDAHVTPLETRLGTSAAVISFVDVGRFSKLRSELARTKAEVETAYEELRSTIEELETTNEELQSTNEELETTNEELHSSNEELETINEELQSTNEELEGINSELRERTVEVEELNFFLESILGSLRSAVIVLDTDMHVHAWNRNAEDLWGLRRDEVNGQHFFNLDIGFPVVQLRDPIRSCLTDAQTVFENDYHAVNRRGRTISCRVAISPLRHGEATRGVIISMESASLDGVGETSPAALDPSR